MWGLTKLIPDLLRCLLNRVVHVIVAQPDPVGVESASHRRVGEVTAGRVEPSRTTEGRARGQVGILTLGRRLLGCPS
jgi:hypothetical protein